MANRTILVDNNTWNNTHISRVGQVRSMLVISGPAMSLIIFMCNILVPNCFVCSFQICDPQIKTFMGGGGVKI